MSTSLRQAFAIAACGMTLAACGKTASGGSAAGPRPTATQTGVDPGVAQATRTATATGTSTATGSAAGAALTFGALGDSITRAINAKSLLVEELGASWATGDAVAANDGSHYARLRKELGLGNVRAINAAVSGATSADLDEQLRQLVPEKPAYVTLLMGANDVCAWPADYAASLAAFTERLDDTLARLIAANDGVRIVVASVPDLNKLYELKKGQAACTAVWSLAGFCPELLGQDSTPARRAAFRTRWQAMNGALQAASARQPRHARFVPEVAAYDFKDEHVSALDCFHPSVAGQKLIADLTWNAVFAAAAR